MEMLREHGQAIKKIGMEEIKNNIEEIKKLANEIKWEGPSREKFKEEFNKKMESINYIPTVIEAYGEFMMKASGGYDEINDKMYNDYLSEVNKNSKRYKNK
jgi:hypothetical protein